MNTEYQKYLQSERWKFTADAAKKRFGYRCQVCNGIDGPLDAHHRTYERLGDERDEDITVLCRVCHRLFHENKRGELVPPNQEWLSQVAAHRPFFFKTVIAQANALTFAHDGTVCLLFGPEVPPFIFDVVRESTPLCGRDMIVATSPEFSGSSMRFATDEEVQAAIADGRLPPLPEPMTH